MADAGPISQTSFTSLVHDVGDDPAMVADLIKAYLDAAPRIMSLRDAVLHGELDAAARYAHESKGASASPGADHPSDLCLEVELHPRTQEPDDSDEHVNAIAAEATRVRAARARARLVT